MKTNQPDQNKRDYRIFKSSQQGVHPQLKKITHIHIKNIFRKPEYSHSTKIFEKIKNFCAQFYGPLILDTGCGTGLSTINLAQRFPYSPIIGLDKSLSRLRKSPASSQKNFLLVQADYFDIWQLIINSNLRISHHFIFYPNPWPKISHVKRRIYAHPLFPAILQKSNYFELRTNWNIYTQDLIFVLKLLNYQPRIQKIKNLNHISLFEKKYLEQNCDLYQISCYRSSKKN